MKIAKLMKAALGSGGMDEMLELCSAAGIEVTLDPVPVEQKPAVAELEAIADAAIQPGAKFFRLTAEAKGKPPVVAFVVLKAT